MFPGQKEWSSIKTQAVLFFGYLPNHGEIRIPKSIREAAREGQINGSKHELVRQGRDCIRQTFERQLSELPANTHHVVPLSGGLDSRTILAALLNHEKINKSNISTITFGTPGTWDFELSQEVAKAAGVENEVIDLTSTDVGWSIDDLVETAAWAERPVPILEARINKIPAEKYSKQNTVLWSGFMGDPTVGSHQPSSPCDNWNCALEHFIDNNKQVNKHDHPITLDPKEVLPSTPFIDRAKLSYEEQLDYAIRQQKYIKPIVAPSDELYVKPFIDERWLSFWLNIPPSERNDRRLFKKIVKKEFPNLFSLPTSTNYGLSISRHPFLGKVNGAISILTRKFCSELKGHRYIHPNMNYAPFDDLMRDSDRLAPATEELLLEVNNRDGIYIDVETLWKEHQSGENHSNLFSLLLSIESHLRFKE
ncbi:asparagine synthase-related protein [Natronorubrum sulfidifaciens]|uniref:asparagine synthase-related protein n=1 Tax=Natronorubrum sulfidifaciens TaxID=388259 RepID=UPI000ACC3673|nr:asparagine synthase C-terminal domain-containing protein [Natronorubrum sulfidifaciens]